MPTKKKRVGFIPRNEVIEIIDRLGKENNLSNSKIISILVEEALYTRGLFNKKNIKEDFFYKKIDNDSKQFSNDKYDFKDNDQFSISTNLNNHQNAKQTSLLKQTNHDSFDLQTYKKFLSFLKFQEMIDEYND